MLNPYNDMFDILKLTTQNIRSLMDTVTGNNSNTEAQKTSPSPGDQATPTKKLHINYMGLFILQPIASQKPLTEQHSKPKAQFNNWITKTYVCPYSSSEQYDVGHRSSTDKHRVSVRLP